MCVWLKFNTPFNQFLHHSPGLFPRLPYPVDVLLFQYFRLHLQVRRTEREKTASLSVHAKQSGPFSFHFPTRSILDPGYELLVLCALSVLSLLSEHLFIYLLSCLFIVLPLIGFGFGLLLACLCLAPCSFISKDMSCMYVFASME